MLKNNVLDFFPDSSKMLKNNHKVNGYFVHEPFSWHFELIFDTRILQIRIKGMELLAFEAEVKLNQRPSKAEPNGMLW